VCPLEACEQEICDKMGAMMTEDQYIEMSC
jgi:hypothetical protein